jgi:hypothetical protein
VSVSANTDISDVATPVEKHAGSAHAQHREEQTTEDELVEMPGGMPEYILKTKLHCEDGPVARTRHGGIVWCQRSRIHGEDGPAIECFNGTKNWYINGQLRREDAPAIERANGRAQDG